MLKPISMVLWPSFSADSIAVVIVPASEFESAGSSFGVTHIATWKVGEDEKTDWCFIGLSGVEPVSHG